MSLWKMKNENMKIASNHRQYILCILEPIAADFSDNEVKKPISLNGLNLVNCDNVLVKCTKYG